jgi:hypothetical protein
MSQPNIEVDELKITRQQPFRLYAYGGTDGGDESGFGGYRLYVLKTKDLLTAATISGQITEKNNLELIADLRPGISPCFTGLIEPTYTGLEDLRITGIHSPDYFYPYDYYEWSPGKQHYFYLSSYDKSNNISELVTHSYNPFYFPGENEYVVTGVMSVNTDYTLTGLQFRGNNDNSYVYFSNGDTFYPTIAANSGSISFWCLFYNSTAGNMIGKTNDNIPAPFDIQWLATNKIRFVLGDGLTAASQAVTYQLADSTQVLSTGIIYNIGISYERVLSPFVGYNVNFYVSGQFSSSSGILFSHGASGLTSSGLYLGSRLNGDSPSFSGVLYDIHVFSGVLTESQFRDLYLNSGVASDPTISGLLYARFPMEENTGTHTHQVYPSAYQSTTFSTTYVNWKTDTILMPSGSQNLYGWLWSSGVGEDVASGITTFYNTYLISGVVLQWPDATLNPSLLIIDDPGAGGHEVFSLDGEYRYGILNADWTDMTLGLPSGLSYDGDIKTLSGIMIKEPGFESKYRTLDNPLTLYEISGMTGDQEARLFTDSDIKSEVESLNDNGYVAANKVVSGSIYDEAVTKTKTSWSSDGATANLLPYRYSTFLNGNMPTISGNYLSDNTLTAVAGAGIHSNKSAAKIAFQTQAGETRHYFSSGITIPAIYASDAYKDTGLTKSLLFSAWYRYDGDPGGTVATSLVLQDSLGAVYSVTIPYSGVWTQVVGASDPIVMDKTDFYLYLKCTGTPASLKNLYIDNVQVEINTKTGSTVPSPWVPGANLSGLTGVYIPDKSLTGSKIVDATISGALITPLTISGALMTNATITGSKIASATISGALITPLTISGALMADTTITAGKIGTGAVTETKIGTGAVTVNKLGTGAVSSLKILDNTILEADISWSNYSVNLLNNRFSDPQCNNYSTIGLGNITPVSCADVPIASPRGGAKFDYVWKIRGSRDDSLTEGSDNIHTWNSGDVIVISMMVYGGNGSNCIISLYDSAGSSAGSYTFKPNYSTWTHIETAITTSRSGPGYLFIDNTASVVDVYFSLIQVEKASSGKTTASEYRPGPLDNYFISSMLCDGAVLESNIADSQVTGAKIATATVSGIKITNATLTSGLVAPTYQFIRTDNNNHYGVSSSGVYPSGLLWETDNIGFTQEGGYAVKYQIHEACQKGYLVRASTNATQSGLVLTNGSTSDERCVGVAYQQLNSGQIGWFVIGGIAEVYSATAPKMGYYVGTTNIAGNADAQKVAGSTLNGWNNTHIGFSLEEHATAGTLVKVILKL